MSRPTVKACRIASCSRVPSKGRLCSMHEARKRRGKDMDAPPFAERDFFASRFEAGDVGQCWPWLGGRTTEGYGWSSSNGGQYAHRVAYERAKGLIGFGLVIDHLCRNRLCVNPDHLEAVSQRVNVLRGMAPSAICWRTGRCGRGHEFTPENTYLRPDNGYRQCRACIRLRSRGVAS